nr:hypothetical protein [Rubrobacter marinus]
MVGADVQERRHVEAGVLEVVEPEGRDLQDERAGLADLLQAAGEGAPGVARNGVRDPGGRQAMPDHVHYRRLAVRPGDGRDLEVRGLPPEQLQPQGDLGGDRDAVPLRRREQGVAGADAGARDDPVEALPEDLRTRPEARLYVEGPGRAAQRLGVVGVGGYDVRTALGEGARGGEAGLPEAVDERRHTESL